MKKLFIAALFLLTTLAHAEEVTILDTRVPMMDPYRSFIDTSFQMDRTTGAGFVKVTVSSERWVFDGWGRRLPMPVMIFQDKVKVEGLMLMGDQVIYHGTEGDVNCGRMGLSRVFKVPTLYLSGNCKLTGKFVGHRYEGNLVVTLKTKKK